MPNQLRLFFYFWTKKAIKDLILMLWKIDMAFKTRIEYVKRLGCSPQNPLKKDYVQDPKKVKKWL